DLFAEDKILRESFLSRDFLKKIIKKDLTSTQLKNLIFKLGAQLSLGLIDNETVSKNLSESITQRISVLVKTNIEKLTWAKDYFIMVLGSTGMKTMSFASDVDLIFVVRNLKKYETIQREFQELFGILKKELSHFQVDFRLRPEGESSQLVWDFEKYFEYIDKRARIWELQSFLKTRFVCGNKKLFIKLIDSFIHRTSRLTKDEILKGITDVRAKSLSSFPAEMNLIDNYIFIKKLEIFNQLLFSSSSSKIADDELRYTKLAHMMRIKNGQTLKTKLGSILKMNREQFSKIIFNK
ncbi:MAG: hypothetical protein P8X47_03040, partial [Ignavibacteriaceae bacterium]